MKILVVDDEERLRRSLRRGLEADGFAVDEAATGIDGLAMATEGDYDAIVLDLMMPGHSGFRVCAELRRREVWTPILVLTAKDGDLDEAEALETGADDYLRKPFSHAVLRRTAARPDPTQRWPGSTDAERRRPGGGPGPAHLPTRRHRDRAHPREFAVLEHLMRHAGHVVTKRDLLDSVWDVDYEGDENIVEVYVAHLRRKIDHPFDRSTIQTVRGAGYRIREDGR